MYRSIATGLAAALVAFGLITQAQAGWNSQRSKAADALLAQNITSKAPTISACVAIDGNVVYANAVGNIAPGVPATAQTIYRIGSLSKQFTAAGILALIEDGAVVPSNQSKFGLDDNLSFFFNGLDPSWLGGSFPPETVRRLLNMRSNLPQYTDQPPPGLDPGKAVDAGALLNGIVGSIKPTGVPLQYQYSNTNYFLLASIIDVLTNANTNSKSRKQQTGPVPFHMNADYRAYLRKRIFARAGLTATNFIDDPAPLGAIAPPVDGQWFSLPSWPKGAGAIQSNVLDLCAWDKALMGGKVISPASVATMGTAPNGQTYAMGWWRTQNPTYLEYQHNGFIFGYTAQTIIDFFNYLGKTHTVFVNVLTNGDQMNLYPPANTLAQSAMKPALPTPLPIPVPPSRY